MEDIDGGLHPAVDGQSLDERWDENRNSQNKVLDSWKASQKNLLCKNSVNFYCAAPHNPEMCNVHLLILLCWDNFIRWWELPSFCSNFASRSTVNICVSLFVFVCTSAQLQEDLDFSMEILIGCWELMVSEKKKKKKKSHIYNYTAN